MIPKPNATPLRTSTASEQIRDMLASRPCEQITLSEWQQLDGIMHSQRVKHGDEATAWWFREQRLRWLAKARNALRGDAA